MWKIISALHRPPQRRVRLLFEQIPFYDLRLGVGPTKRDPTQGVVDFTTGLKSLNAGKITAQLFNRWTGWSDYWTNPKEDEKILELLTRRQREDGCQRTGSPEGRRPHDGGHPPGSLHDGPADRASTVHARCACQHIGTAPIAPLHLPSFLHGPRSTIERKARAEGRRCAAQYLLDGSFPHPRELRAVAPDAVVLTHEVIDFRSEDPAWRLYAVWEVVMSLSEALEGKNHHQARDAHEAFFRETAWGALYFATAQLAPESAERTGLRLKAVLRFWDALQHGRYLFKKPNHFLTLEVLMSAVRGWAMEAWCPEGADSVRARLEVAAERMTRSTREECVEVLLRQLPRILPLAEGLKHPEVVTSITFWREQLARLDARAFERLSGAGPAWVLERLYMWDRELEAH